MFEIAGRVIGPDCPVYIVAELSANHLGSLDRAIDLVHAAGVAGADAVKLQTYTADTITIDCDTRYFQASGGVAAWHGKTLYELYAEAATPWGWFPRLRDEAAQRGMTLFSSVFDSTSVDFLEGHNARAYKVSAFELPDLELLRYVAATGKPVILSTGMATGGEINEALNVLRAGGAKDIALLKCTSAYPAKAESMNLRAIQLLADVFGDDGDVAVGLSDHTIGDTVATAAVAMGACIVEKHLTLSRADGGPDGAFSSEEGEFGAMVKAIRATEDAMGEARLGPVPAENAMVSFRRSLFVVEDLKTGDEFTRGNVRSIRPGHGLHPRHMPDILGKRARRDVVRGMPLQRDMVAL